MGCDSCAGANAQGTRRLATLHLPSEPCQRCAAVTWSPCPTLTLVCSQPPLQGYKPPEEGPSEYQTIPLDKIEDFGVHCKQVGSWRRSDARARTHAPCMTPCLQCTVPCILALTPCWAYSHTPVSPAYSSMPSPHPLLDYCTHSAVLLAGHLLLQVLAGFPPAGPAVEQVLGAWWGAGGQCACAYSRHSTAPLHARHAQHGSEGPCRTYLLLLALLAVYTAWPAACPPHWLKLLPTHRLCAVAGVGAGVGTVVQPAAGYARPGGRPAGRHRWAVLHCLVGWWWVLFG